MVNEVQSWFNLSDGAKLYAKTWIPDEPARAHLIFLHGFSDRCDIHHALFPTLSSPQFSIQVHSFDQRGWGKSVTDPKHTGDTGTTDLVLQDFHEFVRHVASTIPDIADTPLFIMGHSMGGQETLHYVLTTRESLLKDRPRISGYVCEAPYVKLDPMSQPSGLLVFTGKVAAKVLPKFKLKQVLHAQYITRDPKMNQEWADDQLCHDTGTLEGLRDMIQRAADLDSLSSTSSPVPPSLSTTLSVPTLWTHGTEDRVTAFAPSKALFDRLSGPPAEVVPKGIEGKSFKAYEGAYHKIHCEPDGLDVQFAQDVAKWILSVVDAQKSEAGVVSSKAKL